MLACARVRCGRAFGSDPAVDPLHVPEVAERHGATTAQVALAWLLAVSPVTLPIPGTGSLEHLEENVAATAIQLTEEDLTDLAANESPRVRPTPRDR